MKLTNKTNKQMKEIDNMLDQWIHSSIIRAKLREAIIDMVDDKKIEAFKDGVIAGLSELREINK